MEYGKGLGIAAIVFAILAIFVPFVGFYVAILASCLAIAAAFFGDKAFVLATSAVTAVNLYFLTLTTWVIPNGVYIVGLVVVLPIAVMIFKASSAKRRSASISVD